MKLAPQSKPYTPRQIARMLSVALKLAGWISPTQAQEAMSANGPPEMLINVADPTGPNGMRSFIISVREVS